MRARTLVFMIAAFGVLLVPSLAQAKATDRDHDSLPDRWEKRHHLSTNRNSANADTDRDRVDNRNEYVEGTDPRDRDSDNDGRRDGREDRDRDRLNNAAEDATANDPTDRDTDNDGVIDGKEQAGVVTAYENGELTIDLASGGSVTAKVTDRTRVRCSSEDDAEDAESTSGATTSRHGDDRRGSCDGFGDDDGDECPAGTLKVGAKIHEARIRVTSDGAAFAEIKVIS